MRITLRSKKFTHKAEYLGIQIVLDNKLLYSLISFLIAILSNPLKAETVKGFTPTESLIYKQINNTTLKLHTFNPEGHKASDKRPAIIFFFAGAWKGGDPSQFYPHCKYLASRGMVAISAEYRVKSRNNTSPKECVKDAKSAVRWVRKNAQSLGIDKDKIAVGGGSAGGHIAAATGTVKSYNEDGEDLSISCIPNAMVLFSPVYNNGPGGYKHEDLKAYWQDISPMHNINEKTPPTIVFMGTKDKHTPAETAQEYKSRMLSKQKRCDLHLYKDEKHGFYNFKNTEMYKETVLKMDQFLISEGFITEKIKPVK